MQFTLLIAFVIVAAVSAKFADRADEHWEIFKGKFQRSYETEEEHSRRKGIFAQNMIRVDKKNEINKAANGEEVFGLTKFSDWTEEEFSVLLGRKNRQHKPNGDVNVLAPVSFEGKGMRGLGALPSYVNWGSSGKVTPVKNQGQCGSCWAFSTAETVESQWAMNGNPIWEFSIQQIASCTTSCHGCGGGDTPQAYDYIASVIGLGSAAWAPYVQSMTTGCSLAKCTAACSNYNMNDLATKSFYTGPYASIPTTGSFTYATPACTAACNSQNTSLLAANIATYGPASICVNAASWASYTGGVMSQAACGGYAYSNLDHCVQLTGYNAAATNPYWLVRNSWATNWGEKGYILLQYPQNTCGLADEATFVTLSNSQANFTSAV